MKLHQTKRLFLLYNKKLEVVLQTVPDLHCNVLPHSQKGLDEHTLFVFFREATQIFSPTKYRVEHKDEGLG